MESVRITGWRAGLQKVSLTKLIQSHSSMGLKDAKQVVDRILGGAVVSISLRDGVRAADFARNAEEIGAVTDRGGDL